MELDRSFWRGRRVLVTGHTGFKGAWLSFWLAEMGAEVSGVALAPEGNPSLFGLLGLDKLISSTIADINDRAALEAVFSRSRPEVVLHLAAQALVRASYADPVQTFATNVTGVVTLLDVVRSALSVRAVVVVTSDKCYDNKEWVWGYRETDALGGRDPYSASKGCAEIAARSMQMSYFAPFAPGGHAARIATARAGNVIGGGDWSRDRLVPDIVRGCLSQSGVIALRNPHAVRPWQHVLEPLAAYLMLAQRLLTAPDGFDDAWNIGPNQTENRRVLEVAEAMLVALGRGRLEVVSDAAAPHEANLLMLDCSKARTRLNWRPQLDFDATVALTADWYGAWLRGEDIASLSRAQIAIMESNRA